jgi:O-antigen ligase
VPLFLVPLDAFALAIALYGDVPRERVVAWFFLAVTVPASVLSLSRAGWAALAVVIVLIGLFHRRRVLLIGVPALAAAILAAALPGARERIGVEFDLANRFNSVSLRFSLWRSALNMLLHQPLFGGGLAGFRRSLQPYQERDYGEQQIYPRTLSIGLLAALAAIFVHGQVDVPYFKNDLALEFWTLLGIQFGALRAANGIDSHP